MVVVMVVVMIVLPRLNLRYRTGIIHYQKKRERENKGEKDMFEQRIIIGTNYYCIVEYVVVRSYNLLFLERDSKEW